MTRAGGGTTCPKCTRRQDLPGLHRGPRTADDERVTLDLLSRPRTGVDDPARLAAVARLDLPGHAGEPDLDGLVRALAAGCGAPVAVVNLVRPGSQTYVAEVGVGAGTSSVCDRLSFCAEVVQTGRPLVVADATAHTRYAQNPLVRAGAVRAYAGVPVVHDGVVVGTVSVFDTVARAWSPADLALLAAHGRLAGTVLALRDAARFDPLTGLYHRRHLVERGRTLLREGPVLGLLVDVDGFGAVNDLHGHVAGDAVLRAVGRLLQQRTAEVPGAVLGRWGGDEFLVLLPGADVAHAVRLAEALADPLPLTPSGAPLTLTVGVAAAEPGRAVDDLVADASLAVRRGGDGRVVLCDDAVREEVRARLVLERDLRRAVEGEALVLHLQPFVPVDGSPSTEAEALVRWTRDGVPVRPDVFVPLAEESGLVHDLTRWVLQAACAAVARWRREHGGARRVWVNLSARDLRPALRDDVLAALARHDLPTSALGIEVTETAVLGDAAAAAQVLHQLRRAGVAVALDDFGTGWSSLSRLRELPVDVLKLDRSFVAQARCDDPQHLAFLRAVVGVGQALGLRVVGEGVETEQEHRALVDAGCDLLQGYLFARPAPLEALLGRAVVPEPRRG